MFSEKELDRMREELENPELMKQRIEEEKQANIFIEKTKERFKLEGRDFWKEFEEWKKSK